MTLRRIPSREYISGVVRREIREGYSFCFLRLRTEEVGEVENTSCSVGERGSMRSRLTTCIRWLRKQR